MFNLHASLNTTVNKERAQYQLELKNRSLGPTSSNTHLSRAIQHQSQPCTDSCISPPCPAHPQPHPVFNKRPGKITDQSADHAAQRPTCDLLSRSKARYQLERHVPLPSSSKSSNDGGGFAVGLRGGQKHVLIMRSMCCRRMHARAGMVALMCRRCLAPGRVLGSGWRPRGRQELSSTAVARVEDQGGYSKEVRDLTGETKMTG